MQAQHLDEGALADARHAGQADAQRLAAGGQQGVQQLVGARAVVGPLALEQRDGPGQRAALARALPFEASSAASMADRVAGLRPAISRATP
jgi:hypothetical protein